MDCWEVNGGNPVVENELRAAKSESVMKGEEGRPQKKAQPPKEVRSEVSTTFGGMTKEKIKKGLKDIVDAMRNEFGMCLREIKLLGDRMEAVELKSESMNGAKAKAGQNDAKPSGSAKPKQGELEGRQRRLMLWNMSVERVSVAPSQQYPFKRNIAVKLITQNKKFGQGYDLFAPADKKMTKLLNEWLKLDPSGEQTTKMSKSVLSGPPNPLRMAGQLCKSSAIYILMSSHMDAWINVLRQQYQENRSHFRSKRIIASHISPEQLDEVMESSATMVLYVLVECTGTGEQRVRHTLEPYTYEKQTVEYLSADLVIVACSL
ncbi:uncharacterized protein LOC108824793 [Raphanus sativus]|uniref:Uncharacterized protein LOC108824793 n=1 Tax=Raphanus sativus TaxID=3726 RepID=A0A9W3CH39_RAPSA|nr:uncharacterized protein LOC108824793 [Raphanus sativus]